MRDEFNGRHYTKGPLYSKRELARMEEYLIRDCFVYQEELSSLGTRHYERPDKSAQAVLYTGEKSHLDITSGMMFITYANGSSEGTTIWAYTKKRRIAEEKNPVLRLAKRIL
jgi:hypothetical protein